MEPPARVLRVEPCAVDHREVVAPDQPAPAVRGQRHARRDQPALTFHVGPGNYHVAVRHRNHLGCMTTSSIALSAVPVAVDLSSPSLAVWGTNARRSVGPQRALWPGNTVPDSWVLYTGAANDRDPILQEIGGLVPTNIATGYLPGDVNMDGSVIYTGADNDREVILVALGGASLTNSIVEQLP